MRHTESGFRASGGLKLFRQSWLPEGKPKAILAVVHGLAEHSSRYGNLVGHFVPRGYGVCALDLRGHGHSEGRRGYVERFDCYVDDVTAFLDIVRGEHPGQPVFLLGHSMGGTIAAACAVRAQDALAGLLLSGAVLKPGSSLSAVEIMAARIMSRVAPKLGITTLDSSTLSHDPEVVAGYDNDPLVYRGRISARLGGELLAALRTLPQAMPQIRLPVLIMHGADDRLSEPQGSQLLHDRVSSGDKTLVIYEGFYHEIFNEPERERVFVDMERWLAART